MAKGKGGVLKIPEIFFSALLLIGLIVGFYPEGLGLGRIIDSWSSLYIGFGLCFLGSVGILSYARDFFAYMSLILGLILLLLGLFSLLCRNSFSWNLPLTMCIVFSAVAFVGGWKYLSLLTAIPMLAGIVVILNKLLETPKTNDDNLILIIGLMVFFVLLFRCCQEEYFRAKDYRISVLSNLHLEERVNVLSMVIVAMLNNQRFLDNLKNKVSKSIGGDKSGGEIIPIKTRKK